MVLDGELVAGDGMPSSFYRLAGRLSASRPDAVARGMRTTPVTLVVFDLLWLEGRPLLDDPYCDRRSLLEELGLHGPSWATTVTYDDGDALLAAAAQLGAEGGVAKVRRGRLARYVPGTRSPGWVKRKARPGTATTRLGAGQEVGPGRPDPWPVLAGHHYLPWRRRSKDSRREWRGMGSESKPARQTGVAEQAQTHPGSPG